MQQPVINNNTLFNNENSIHIGISINNEVIDNEAFDGGIGIQLSICSGCTIINNTVSNNGQAGIDLHYSNDVNTIYNNTISNNFRGINLYDTDNSIFIENTISSSPNYGIYLFESHENFFYHNSIKWNSNQAYDDGNDTHWDNDYPSGGNYWSDYSGIDTFKGPYQNISGSDGIGDTNYSIDADSTDRYPLMAPYKPLENYTILKEGWNLISIPLIQEEQNLTRVLGSIDSWYDAVQWHDISDTGDPWKHNKVGKPFGNDLLGLNESMGFWVHITNPGDTIFLYNGSQPTVNLSIPLHPGWNMVGYPSLTNRTRDNALNNINYGSDVDAIWTFDAATQTWQEIGPTDYFELGRGYWIHSKVTKVWDVPL